jgi:branched-chain amino acid transport system permease protein
LRAWFGEVLMSATDVLDAAAGSRFNVVRGTVLSRVFGVFSLLVIVGLVTVPTWADVSTVRKLVQLFILLAVAQMWNLLAGFAGLASVGQQAFVGLGAYGMVILVNNQHYSLYWSILFSGVLAALVSIPMGLIAFRLRGSYFAIGTWVLAEVARISMKNWKTVGGGSGASLKVSGYKAASRSQSIYWIALVIGIGAIILAYAVLRSRLGLQLQAIRDNEAGAKGLGANVYRTRFLLWVVVAFWTALAGAAYYTQNLRVQPNESFSVANWTAPIIFMVVIGGIGSIEGPIVGAIAYWAFHEWFGNSPFYLIAVGFLAVLISLFVRRGLWGLVRKRFDLQLFPVRRRLTS